MGKENPTKPPDIFPACPAPCAIHPGDPRPPRGSHAGCHWDGPAPLLWGAKSQRAQKAKIEMKGGVREAPVHMHFGFERFVRTKEALSSLSKVL